MSKQWAFLFPGQGAQYPGMAKDFYEAFAVSRATFEEADHHLNTPFSTLIFEGPAFELTLTKNSQLAIYIASIAILRVVQANFPDLQPAVCGGLSLGEYTALVAAGRLTFTDGLDLVRLRAQYMQEACEKIVGEMHVVLGLEVDLIREVLNDLKTDVWIANLNCPSQVVIAGTPAGIQLVAPALKQKGAKRILPLDVSGAFHTPLMRFAQEKLTPAIHAAPFLESSKPIVMNVPGVYVSDLPSIRQFLIDQVASPVLWEKGILSMNTVDAFLEMGPGKTLAGMNKRIGVLPPTCSIATIADLEGMLCHC